MCNQGTIFDIKRYSIHDGPGIRTTVFFKGCPLDCVWCHNPESRLQQPEVLRDVRRPADRVESIVGCTVTVETVIADILRDELYYDQSCGGVTLSGGEPLQQPQFLRELLAACRELHMHTLVDTSGQAEWEDILAIANVTDLFYYDLKIINPEEHHKYVGVDPALIHENLRRLVALGAEVVIRLPMIPGITDTEQNIADLAEFLAPLEQLQQIDLLPYNPLGEDKAERYCYPVRYSFEGKPAMERVVAAQKFLTDRGYRVEIEGQ